MKHQLTKGRDHNAMDQGIRKLKIWVRRICNIEISIEKRVVQRQSSPQTPDSSFIRQTLHHRNAYLSRYTDRTSSIAAPCGRRSSSISGATFSNLDAIAPGQVRSFPPRQKSHLKVAFCSWRMQVYNHPGNVLRSFE